LFLNSAQHGNVLGLSFCALRAAFWRSAHPV
jgi:hypothetical protein